MDDIVIVETQEASEEEVVDLISDSQPKVPAHESFLIRRTVAAVLRELGANTQINRQELTNLVQSVSTANPDVGTMTSLLELVRPMLNLGKQELITIDESQSQSQALLPIFVDDDIPQLQPISFSLQEETNTPTAPIQSVPKPIITMPEVTIPTTATSTIAMPTTAMRTIGRPTTAMPTTAVPTTRTISIPQEIDPISKKRPYQTPSDTFYFTHNEPLSISQFTSNHIDSMDIEDPMNIDDDIHIQNTSSLIRTNTISEPIIVSEVSSLDQVLVIFPQAKVSFVRSLLQRFKGDATQVLQEMVDHGYEKEDLSTSQGNTSKISNSVNENEKDRDFDSTTDKMPEDYFNCAVAEVQCAFPFIALGTVRARLEAKNRHFWPTIQQLEKDTGRKAILFIDENYRKPFKASQDDFNQLKILCEAKQISVRRTGKCPSLPADPPKSFIAEREWVAIQRQKEYDAKAKAALEEKMNRDAEAAGTQVECGCCYGEYAFELMVQCSDGHLFCRECLKRYVEQMIFGNGQIALKCFNSSETCCGTFPESILRISLPEKVLEKYSEALAREALKSAHLDDLVTCHKCALQVELPADAGIVLHCPECSSETCRKCGDPAHIPLRCEEVEKESESKRRLGLEERMTAARVRECPTCKTRFFKEEGCNKMTCSCRTLICYLCRANISKIGYAHFCNTPHCTHETCKKCTLYSSAEEDDKRVMRELAQQELKVLEGETITVDDGDGNNTEDRLARQLDTVKKLMVGLEPSNKQARVVAMPFFGNVEEPPRRQPRQPRHPRQPRQQPRRGRRHH